MVYPGENIQDKVSGASAGDVVIIRGGTYPDQNVTMSQPIRLVREKGTTVTIGGTITLSGISGEVVLRDFAINVNDKGKLVVKNCTKVGLEDLTLLPQGVEIENSTVVMRSCQLGPLSVSAGSDLELIKSNAGALDSNASGLKIVETDFTTADLYGGSALLQESNASDTVRIENCAWRAHETHFQRFLAAKNCHSVVMRSTIDDAFAHFGPTYDCTIFQSTFGQQHGHVLYSDANRTYVTYSTLHTANLKGGAEAHFIGNVLDASRSKSMPGLYADSPNASLLIKNNRFYSGNNSTTFNQSGNHGYDIHDWKLSRVRLESGIVNSFKHNLHERESNIDARCRIYFYYFDGSIANQDSIYWYTDWRSPDHSWKSFTNPNPDKQVISTEVWMTRGYERNERNYAAIHLENAQSVEIQNNLFHDWARRAHDVEVVSAPVGGLKIQGNAFYKSSALTKEYFSVKAPQRNGNLCTHNYFSEANKAVEGGIAHFDNLLGGDPGFVDYAGNDFRLGNSSPLSDQGPSDPEFNDLDGSRNDLGMYGGHSYDPNGSTSSLPVVIAGQQSIYRMNIGDSTPIVIKARAAVSTPKQD